MAKKGIDINWEANWDPKKMAQQFVPNVLRDQTPRIMVQAVNKVAGKANTFSRRMTARAMGVKVGYLRARGWSLRRASIKTGRVEATIFIRGRPTNIGSREFGGRQLKKGVSSKAWGKRKVHEGTFLINARGTGGGTWAASRKGKKRLPIKAKYGPWAPRIYDQRGQGGRSIRNMTEAFAATDLPRETKRASDNAMRRLSRKQSSRPMRRFRR